VPVPQAINMIWAVYTVISMSILNGFLFGCTISLFSYGAVFFLMIKIGIETGIRPALFFESGHLFSILFVLIIVNFGFLKIPQLDFFEKFLSLVGGVFLIAYGLIMYFNTKSKQELNIKSNQSNLQLFLQGFIVNLLNPTDLIIWIGVLGTNSIRSGFSLKHNFIFGASTLAGIAFIDILKIVLAKKIGKNIFSKNYQIISRVVG